MNHTPIISWQEEGHTISLLAFSAECGFCGQHNVAIEWFEPREEDYITDADAFCAVCESCGACGESYYTIEEALENLAVNTTALNNQEAAR